MHPAYSVIVFTTASGAGYGLLVWLAALLVTGRAPAAASFGFFAMAVALGLVTAGLLSSTTHLGRPERAWRALSQWRTSWLSREGVLALATYVPAGLLGLAWVFGDPRSGSATLAALLLAPLALATVWATGMIYQSLPTIRAWHQPLVAPLYVLIALATGGLLAVALLAAYSAPYRAAALGTLILLAIAWVAKARYWTSIDAAPRTLTAESATGLGRFGQVTPLDPPHTQANFVMREMGFEIARKHALKLRGLAAVMLFAVPLAALVLALVSAPEWTPLWAIAAVVAATLGVLTERWLFFAEAEHVAMLYYGRKAA